MSQPLSTPKGSVAIRPAVPQDAVLLRELRLEALASQPEAFAADYALTAADSADVWGTLIAKNAQQNSGVLCVASAGEQLVGMTGLGRGHWPKTCHSATIWGVFVRPAWRGHHLAQALIEACSDWARPQGVVTVKLGVVTSNTAAIRCYARCGFTIYGIEPKAIYHSGVFYDELLMAKPL
ncbi:MAG: GNAT family N-acetyltransferase [Chloroflexota bacterium]